VEDVDRPGPGEELNSGAVTPPRLAATVILLRGGAEALELLLVKRNPEARFMGGVWVFPGGAVDASEGEGDAALRAAAVRELDEEAGIRLDDPSAIVPFSRWITPAEVKIRFDTWFFLALAPNGAEPRSTARTRSTRAGSRRRPRSTRNRAGRILARVPDDQAPRAAHAVRDGRRADRRRAGQEVLPVQPKVVIGRRVRSACCCPASRATTTWSRTAGIYPEARECARR
jgi:8-oxo-dGTP pyrophosphatase MutT (NUDIX family)